MICAVRKSQERCEDAFPAHCAFYGKLLGLDKRYQDIIERSEEFIIAMH